MAAQDPALNQAGKELRTLLERFANGQSIDPITDAMNVLIDDANRDPELRDWFKDGDAYIRKVRILDELRFPRMTCRPFRFSSNPATCSSQPVTIAETSSGNPAVDSSMISIVITSTTSSPPLAIGSRQWARIPSTFVSARIGDD